MARSSTSYSPSPRFPRGGKSNAKRRRRKSSRDAKRPTVANWKERGEATNGTKVAQRKDLGSSDAAKRLKPKPVPTTVPKVGNGIERPGTGNGKRSSSSYSSSSSASSSMSAKRQPKPTGDKPHATPSAVCQTPPAADGSDERLDNFIGKVLGTVDAARANGARVAAADVAKRARRLNEAEASGKPKATCRQPSGDDALKQQLAAVQLELKAMREKAARREATLRSHAEAAAMVAEDRVARSLRNSEWLKQHLDIKRAEAKEARQKHRTATENARRLVKGAAERCERREEKIRDLDAKLQASELRANDATAARDFFKLMVGRLNRLLAAQRDMLEPFLEKEPSTEWQQTCAEACADDHGQLPHRALESCTSCLRRRPRAEAGATSTPSSLHVCFPEGGSIQSAVRIESHKDAGERLWFTKPNAEVSCDICWKRVDKLKGCLFSDPTRSRFMQDIFTCLDCMGSNEADQTSVPVVAGNALAVAVDVRAKTPPREASVAPVAAASVALAV